MESQHVKQNANEITPASARKKEIGDCLREDHAALKALIADVKSDLSSPEFKERAFRGLVRLAAAHARAEEHALLHAARMKPDTLRLAMESEEEHDLAEDFAAKTLRTQNLERREIRMKIYCELLANHLAKLEEFLLPEIPRQWSSLMRQRMAETYAVARSRGGTLSLPSPAELAIAVV